MAKGFLLPVGMVYLSFMEKKMRFAIAGCGRIAFRHAAEMVKHGELVAVADTSFAKAEALASAYRATPYQSLSELLQAQKNIDVIAICTPNGLHATHTIASLKAGVHVLCEKPMALTTTDAAQMIETAVQNNKRLFVVKQNRFNPPVVFIKRLLQQEKLGKINSFQLNCFWNRPAAYFTDGWRGTIEMDGGTLFTQFSHFIDLLYWFLGDIEKVNGIRYNVLHKECIAFEDTGVAHIQMKSGAAGTINYNINAFEKNMEGSLTLFGEKGTVKIGGQYLNELEYFSVRGIDPPLLQKGNPANEYGFYTGSMSNHDKVYEHLVKAIADPAYLFIDPNETKKTIDIIEKIYKASPLLS